MFTYAQNMCIYIKLYNCMYTYRYSKNYTQNDCFSARQHGCWSLSFAFCEDYMTAFLKAMGSHVGSTICELQVGRPGGEGEGEKPMEMEDGCIFQWVFFRVSIWSDLGQTLGCPGTKIWTFQRLHTKCAMLQRSSYPKDSKPQVVFSSLRLTAQLWPGSSSYSKS